MIESQVEQTQPARRALQVPIVRGMTVHEVCDGTAGTVVGITQAYCVYRVADGQQLCVAHWRDLALGNICPAEPLLPADVSENDRRNASATVLCELRSLERLGSLTPAQQAVLEELIALLCSD